MNENTRLLVVVNRTAARARREWPRIRDALEQNLLRFDAHETERAGDGTVAVRKALRAGYNLIAVVGGDGTLSEAAEGFFDLPEAKHQEHALHHAASHPSASRASAFEPVPINEDAALALLPAGTGDDFARGLLGRRASAEEWTSILVSHCLGRESRTRLVDLIYGSASGGTPAFISINVATIGIGAEVAARVAAQTGVVRRLSGEARFLSAAMGALIAWRERGVRLFVDEGEAIERPMNLLAVANSIYAGGGMMFAPGAKVDDGLMDVLFASGLTRTAILRELPRIRRGTHLENPHVQLLKARHVRIETLESQDALPIEADGNLRGHTPAEFRIMPGALRIIL